MKDALLKRCTNPTCAMHGTEVDTTRETCLSCDGKLTDRIHDVFSLDGLFGSPFGRSKS